LIDYSELIFGYRYRSVAIIPELDSNGATLTQHPATLCGEPGTRAPHIMLERAGSPLSTIDLCGGRWTLLAGAQGTVWHEAARQVAQRLDLPLFVYSIGGEHGLKDVEGCWDEAYRVGATGAVLVRPDGFVAWRTTMTDEQPAVELEKALAHVLAR
jgi:putative polyketide hydroxylase